MTPLHMFRLLPIFIVLAASAMAQTNAPSLPQKILLPDGPRLERPEDRERASRNAALNKAQRDEILKADHANNVKDAARIQVLAHEIEQALNESGYATMPAASVKKTEEIEKLAKGIKRRLRRL
ncbi:MAG TPA: hypothetical protein VN428_09770 [Bryobacteraceae bacterium]|nr:hypothetical protein [Bryobacteraceae bacterium]